MIARGKKIKTLSGVKPVEKITKILQRFLEIGPMQKEARLLYKMQDHAYEY